MLCGFHSIVLTQDPDKSSMKIKGSNWGKSPSHLDIRVEKFWHWLEIKSIVLQFFFPYISIGEGILVLVMWYSGWEIHSVSGAWWHKPILNCLCLKYLCSVPFPIFGGMGLWFWLPYASLFTHVTQLVASCDLLLGWPGGMATLVFGPQRHLAASPQQGSSRDWVVRSLA